MRTVARRRVMGRDEGLVLEDVVDEEAAVAA